MVGRMLESISTRMVPPLISRLNERAEQSWSTEFSSRLNLFTGDNGLGKTVLLELVWYCLTFTWADMPIMPYKTPKSQSKDVGATESEDSLFVKPEIGAKVRFDGASIDHESSFDFSKDEWIFIPPAQKRHGIVLYAKANGTYAIWDSNRTPQLDGKYEQAPFYGALRKDKLPEFFRFTSDEILNGIRVDGSVWCRGLLNDWILWQNVAEWKPVFEIFEELLSVLSSEGEPIGLGTAKRLSAFNGEIYPILRLPQGPTPVHFASSGMRRIIDIAYLLAWALTEVGTYSSYSERRVASSVTLIVDELELHLHPQWQRTILPSLLDAATKLGERIAGAISPPEVQIFATSHSPVILASIEGRFDEHKDSIQVLEYSESAKSISLTPFHMSRYGDAGKWLTSPAFGMTSSRSKEAEGAIFAAKLFLKTGEGSRRVIEEELSKTIPDSDVFWVLWNLREAMNGGQVND